MTDLQTKIYLWIDNLETLYDKRKANGYDEIIDITKLLLLKDINEDVVLAKSYMITFVTFCNNSIKSSQLNDSIKHIVDEVESLRIFSEYIVNGRELWQECYKIVNSTKTETDTDLKELVSDTDVNVNILMRIIDTKISFIERYNRIGKEITPPDKEKLFKATELLKVLQIYPASEMEFTQMISNWQNEGNRYFNEKYFAIDMLRKAGKVFEVKDKISIEEKVMLFAKHYLPDLKIISIGKKKISKDFYYVVLFIYYEGKPLMYKSTLNDFVDYINLVRKSNSLVTRVYDKIPEMNVYIELTKEQMERLESLDFSYSFHEYDEEDVLKNIVEMRIL